jgi:hypothetical protein
MLGHKTTILCAAFAASFGSAGMAQDNTTAVDCDAQFTALDTNSDGFLSDTEAPREYARTRIDAITLQETGISATEFASLCASENWVENQPEEGAPFEGANSFTEEQARDRAVAWDVTGVSALTLDEQGIWRGEGQLGGAAVSVAVDYKGNVVTTPKS